MRAGSRDRRGPSFTGILCNAQIHLGDTTLTCRKSIRHSGQHDAKRVPAMVNGRHGVVYSVSWSDALRAVPKNQAWCDVCGWIYNPGSHLFCQGERDAARAAAILAYKDITPRLAKRAAVEEEKAFSKARRRRTTTERGINGAAREPEQRLAADHPGSTEEESRQLP